MASARRGPVFRFGECELDPQLKELRRGGDVVGIEPRAFDLIAYMLAHRDRLIDRDELNAAVWDGRIVSDSALSTCVKQARRAIGDDGQRQDFIRTVPRRGFRFVGEVAEIEHGEAAPAGPPKAASLVWRRPVGCFWAVAVLAGVLALTAAGFWISPSSVSGTPSIAVLPFLAFDGEAEQLTFADGMAEDIITDLSRLDGLLVISRNSSFVFRGEQPQDARRISRTLGARYLLEGSVRRLDGTVRVNAQLIDGTDGTHVWADRFDAPLEDRFELHDRIVEQVVDELSVVLTDRQRRSLRRVGTRDPEAYRMFREARALHDTARSKESAEAFALYKKVLDRDPGFAAAWAADALLSFEIWTQGWNWIMRAREAKARLLESAKRALALDPDNAMARVALAKYHLHHDDYGKAIELSEQAVALLPNGGFNQMALAFMYAIAGEPNAARTVLDRFSRIEPSPDGRTLIGVGWTLLWMGEFAEVVTTLRRARETGDRLNEWWMAQALAASHAQLGDKAAASAERAKMLKMWPAANVTIARTYNQYIRDDDVANRLIEGLERAGLPEWPFDFKGSQEQRLTGAEIRELLFGARLKGASSTGDEFDVIFEENGDWLLRAKGMTFEGQSWIEGDLSCLRSEDLALGHSYCHPYFRNPEGTAAELNEYLTISPYSLRYFSVSK